jgi:hypothetical protein
MKVALVQCPAWGALPPLGPASLKAYLVQHGHDARCFDFNIEFYTEHHRAKAAIEQEGRMYGGPDPWGADAYGQWGLDYDAAPDIIRFQEGSQYQGDEALPLEAWADRLLADDPDVIGFTTYLTSFAPSLLLARELRRRGCRQLLVLGGPNVARDREGDIALRTGLVDAVVHGEGEATLLDLLETLEVGGDLSTVDGIGRLVAGQPVWTPFRPLIRPLDQLPYPDFSDFPWPDYADPYRIPMMGSRGCVLSCSFCYETVYWKRFRMMSPKRIVDEIEHQIARHPLRADVEDGNHKFYVMFGDSLVNGHLRSLREMCDLLIERDLGVNWGGQATVDKRMDDEVCAQLRAAGCTGLAVGLESGSQKVLDDMGKRFEIDDAVDVIRRFHDAGMPLTVNVMVGFPTERRRDFLATVRFLARTRRWLYQVSNVTTTQLALGSELHVYPERFGATIHPDGSWSSSATGEERHRQRRLRALHHCMRALRIPHQAIAPD